MIDFRNSMSFGDCLRHCRWNYACTFISYFKETSLCLFFDQCDYIDESIEEDVATSWRSCEEPNESSSAVYQFLAREAHL